MRKSHQRRLLKGKDEKDASSGEGQASDPGDSVDGASQHDIPPDSGVSLLFSVELFFSQAPAFLETLISWANPTHENGTGIEEPAISQRDLIATYVKSEENERTQRVQTAIKVAAGSFATGGAAGVAGAAGAAGAATLGFMGGVALLPVALPAAAAAGFSTLIGGLFGVTSANAYKDKLETAYGYICHGNYHSANELLKQILEVNPAKRAVRELFLKNRTFAVAHFLYAECAFSEGNYALAIAEYENALRNAKQSKKKQRELLFHILPSYAAFLERVDNTALPKDFDKAEKTREIIRLLKENGFNNHFTSYLDMCNRMKALSQTIRERDFSKQQDDINALVALEMECPVTDIGDGRAHCLAIYFLLFKSMLSALISLHACNVQLDQSITLLTRCTSQIAMLRSKRHAILTDTMYISLVALVKEHAKNIYSYYLTKGIPIDYTFILNNLQIPFPEANQHSAKIEEGATAMTEQLHALLAVIKNDFDMHCDSIDHWLNTLRTLDADSLNKISRKGESFLHILAQIPPGQPRLTANKIREATNKLKSFSSHRSFPCPPAPEGSPLPRESWHENETPVGMLRELKDPYELLTLIGDESPMIRQTSLDKLDQFTEKFCENYYEDNLLLLTGPEGCGKTEAVDYLAEKIGATVHQWRIAATNDQFVNALATRIEEFFEAAKTRARETKETQILLIDNIDVILPKLTGEAPANGQHNSEADIASFVTGCDGLKGHRVILLGITKRPSALNPAIMSRAHSGNSIEFSTPDEAERLKLLSILLKDKKISEENIKMLAEKMRFYSFRQIKNFIENFHNIYNIDLAVLEKKFNANATRIEKEFNDNRDYCASLFMPSFARDPSTDSILLLNPELAAQVEFIARKKFYTDMTPHLLLYGPPGTGKTSSARIIGQMSNRQVIVIRDDSMSKWEAILNRASALRAIVFIDEIDKFLQAVAPNCANPDYVHKLQVAMSGIIKNNILFVAATNKIDYIPTAIMSRFQKIALLKPPTAQFQIMIIQSILVEIKQAASTRYRFHVDEQLDKEMSMQEIRLAPRYRDKMDARGMERAIKRFIEDLFTYIDQTQPTGPSTDICITFEDIDSYMGVGQKSDGAGPSNSEAPSSKGYPGLAYFAKHHARLFASQSCEDESEGKPKMVPLDPDERLQRLKSGSYGTGP
ncbi:MAG TPA: AAA family ATPase [Gammaproteobacteria bacterium]|jgi:SpoVK/Ycf46/Vps4 family AAA+-type ATPase/tetratricopeptide (TPR) repeat protein|nr:AAA family ATPase [Gammaproteobacteria bacterium]